jgi:O-antigen/teichoic acid export membrane protein
VVRVGSHLALARLVSAEAFGLMGLVNSCTTGVELFSDLGVPQKIVHSPRGAEPVFLNTAWTIKSLRGFALWAVTLLLAYPLARFYNTPQLQYLVPVVGLTAILSGFASTNIHLQERNLSLERVVALQIAAQIIAAIVMVAWAWRQPTVWALVAGGLATAGVTMVGSHLVLPGPRNRFQWEPAAAHEVFHFGKWMLPSTIVYFILVLSHRLILGKFVTAEVLGFYNIASFLASFVVMLLGGVSTRVLLPLFARQGEASSNQEFRKRVGRARRNLLVLSLPPLCVLTVFGPQIIHLLYDRRYVGAGWMTQVLAAGAVGDCIITSSGSLLLARGDSRRHFLTLVGGALLLAAFVVTGYLLGGWQGVVIALAASPLARYPALAWGLHRQCVWQPLLDLIALLGSAALVALLWALKAALL